MSSLSVNAIVDANGGSNTSINGFTPSISNMVGRNRIINGAMVIDQRNGGATVSASTSTWSVDRYRVYANQASKLTATQTPSATETGYATRVNAGFTDYMAFVSSSSYSSLTGDRFFVYQGIEGRNVSDLAWGTINAKTVTLSFWAYSSLTGTHSGSLQNNNTDRSYVFTFTISSANTWEYKTITIPGDQSGTWVSNAQAGIYLNFNLGSGATYLGSAGSWGSNYYLGATGSVSVVGTNAATFYITGIQLERGSVATPFEWRPYGYELHLCHRYYQEFRSGAHRSGYPLLSVITGDASRVAIFPGLVSMRVAPTITTYATDNTTSGVVTLFSAGTNQNVSSVNQNGGPSIGSGYLQLSGNISNPVYFAATYSAEL